MREGTSLRKIVYGYVDMWMRGAISFFHRVCPELVLYPDNKLWSTMFYRDFNKRPIANHNNIDPSNVVGISKRGYAQELIDQINERRAQAVLRRQQFLQKRFEFVLHVMTSSVLVLCIAVMLLIFAVLVFTAIRDERAMRFSDCIPLLLLFGVFIVAVCILCVAQRRGNSLWNEVGTACDCLYCRRSGSDISPLLVVLCSLIQQSR